MIEQAENIEKKVFSTSVEVFLHGVYRREVPQSLLHVRGGVSKDARAAWQLAVVFSTSVEVFPRVMGMRGTGLGLLHVHGGVSNANPTRGGIRLSSPRPWRCFPTRR